MKEYFRGIASHFSVLYRFIYLCIKCFHIMSLSYFLDFNRIGLSVSKKLTFIGIRQPASVLRYSAVVLFLTLFVVPTSGCRFFESRQSSEPTFLVTKVIDGDTFWVADGSPKGFKVRLIGVDAPETRRRRNKDVGYYAQESKDFLTDLIYGKEVILKYDVNRQDRYGRTLAYVYLPDGTFINAILVELGYAVVMTVPPNVKYADYFVELQQKARKRKRGLWAE